VSIAGADRAFLALAGLSLCVCGAARLAGFAVGVPVDPAGDGRLGMPPVVVGLILIGISLVAFLPHRDS
jgi:phosphatidylserine synthase